MNCMGIMLAVLRVANSPECALSNKTLAQTSIPFKAQCLTNPRNKSMYDEHVQIN
uniref:Uncharacterized protein n=1 Tax=Rhizophora mucronata TaxID=61149 RepID=A0A2P2N9K0_RHIMU